MGDANYRRALVEVATGARAASATITDARIMSVQSGETFMGTIALLGEHIAYVGPGDVRTDASTKTIDAAGRFVLPGYIEPHAHPFIGYNPDSLSRMCLTRGVTTVVADTLVLQLHLAIDDIVALLDRLCEAPFTWLWAVRTLDQGGRGSFPFGGMTDRLWMLPQTVEVGEVTDWPAIISTPELQDRLMHAKAAGLKIDGHTAGAKYGNLQALVAAGVTACHEAINKEQALDRLRSGLYTILRHSSLRPDIAQWIELYHESPALNWSRCMLTADGSNPAWYAAIGGPDAMVGLLVDGGVPALTAVAMATLNAAQYFGLDESLGMLAPGRYADIQVRSRFDGYPDIVLRHGEVVAREGSLIAKWAAPVWTEYGFARMSLTAHRVADVKLYDGSGLAAEPLGRFESAVIVREREPYATDGSLAPGILRAVLFSSDGRRRASMWIENFADTLDGLATTFVESGSLLVVGRSPDAMAFVARTVVERGGGLAVADGQELRAWIDLSIDGKMSSIDFNQLGSQVAEATSAVRARGYRFEELLYSLDFLTCDFLPTLRLLEGGVYNVKTRQLLTKTVPV